MKDVTFRSFLAAASLALAAAPASAAQAERAKPEKTGKFKAMDANGDGRVSRDEHAAGAQRMFAAMDVDADGMVTAVELDGRSGPQGTSVDRSAVERVKRHDRNNDGQLTSNEHEFGANEMFTKMDGNGDGFLTPEELEARPGPGEKAEKDRGNW